MHKQMPRLRSSCTKLVAEKSDTFKRPQIQPGRARQAAKGSAQDWNKALRYPPGPIAFQFAELIREFQKVVRSAAGPRGRRSDRVHGCDPTHRCKRQTGRPNASNIKLRSAPPANG